MKNSSSKKTVLFLLVLIVLIFVAYYFLYSNLKTKNQNISTLSQELLMQNSTEGYIVSTKKMMDEHMGDINNINNSIISKDGDVTFIENLETIAKNNNLAVEINSLQFEDNPQLSSAGLTSFKIIIKTVGNWGGTYRFLSQLESSSFKVKINKSSIIYNDLLAESGGAWQGAFEIVVLKYK